MTMTAPSSMPEAAIRFSDVSKRYGAVEALAGLTLDVRRGHMLGLIGPDGAGKTTAIRLMCGLLRPDGGEIRVLGLDPIREHRRLTERVGYLSQRFSLYGDLSIDENIAFFAEVHGVREYRRRRDQLLEMTQLTAFRGRLADRLSGGMKQKLALACTLVHEPELILLDEPTTGVDPLSRREFWKLLSEFLASGITILMSTPYLDEAERCTRVALLHEGRVLAADEPSRLRNLIRGRMVEIVTRDSGAADLVRTLPGVADVYVFGERLHVTLSEGVPDRVQEATVGRAAGSEADQPAADDGVERFLAALRATPLASSSARTVPPSLEDVFIARLSAEENIRA
jgi:ABC-2 type transport system ATP-binding protein